MEIGGNANGSPTYVNADFTGSITVDVSATLGDATSRTHIIRGAVTQTTDGSTSRGYDLTVTPVASTAQRLGSAILLQGTFDTTGAAITPIAFFASVSSARSAGANNVINVAVLANASGGQINVALQTNAGSNFLNASSGSTGVGYANTATLPAKFSVTGDAYVSTNVEIDGALNHDGTTVGFYGATPVVQATGVAALTDNTAGTANDTLEAIAGAVYATDVAGIRNNFADLAAKVNALRTVLLNLGLLTA